MTKGELLAIAANVLLAARENARETEGVTDARDEGPEFHAMFVASAKSIRDSIQSPREFRDYGAPRPLTSKEADRVLKMVLGMPERERSLSRAQLQKLVDRVTRSARQNARETEGVTDAAREGPQYRAMFVASAKSIRDSLQSQREHEDYGAPFPLSSKQADRVLAIVLGSAHPS
jgi:hypothetical protein